MLVAHSKVNITK